MAKPFFTEKEKLSLLARIANGEDIEDVVELTGLTKEQIKKYTYNHRAELDKIRQEVYLDLYTEELPPLERVKRVFGERFKIVRGRLILNNRPVTIHEAIRQSNLRLIQEGKKLIYYPGLIEPEANDK